MNIGFDAKRAFHNNTGLGNYSRDLIKGMLDFFPENNYHLFTPKISSNPRLRFLEGKEFKTITPSTPITKGFKSYWRSMAMEKDINSNQIDVFHGLSNEIPQRKFKSNTKYVVTIHDLIFLRHPETYKAIDRRIYDKKFRYACEKADAVIAISEQTKNDIIEFYGTPKDKIKVIYQSCHDQFKINVPEEEIRKIKSKYNLPASYVLYVGTIEQRKNLKALITACSTIDVPIVAVGRKTDYFKEVQNEVEANEMTKRVFFLENIPFENLPAIYQGASLFCYPSIFEGFGIPIIEALYSKIPVITSKGGVFPETGGDASIYIDPFNTDDLRAAIKECLSSEQNERIQKGYGFVQKFSTENFINQTNELYKRIV